MHTVYKVVRPIIGVLYVSAVTDDESLMTYYKLGEKTEAKIGKLFCFNRLGCAVAFAEENHCEREQAVLKCETEEKPVELESRLSVKMVMPTCVEEFWNFNRGVLFECPPGTMVVKSLTPIEVVDWIKE